MVRFRTHLPLTVGNINSDATGFDITYARDWIVNIEDISEFVQQQHQYNGVSRPELLTPSETVYPAIDPNVSQRLGFSISQQYKNN